MYYYLTFSIFHYPYHMQILKYQIADARVSVFFRLLLRGAHINPVILIETDFLKKLLTFCIEQPESGVAIRGPSGTGKTSSCLYLQYKLRTLEPPVPFLACSTSTLKPSIFNPYIESFCAGN